MNKSKEEIHRQMLIDYGTWELNADGAPKWVILPENEPLPQDGYYFDTKAKVTVKGENSGEEIGHAYIVIRGSHTYNTKEMSDLINGVVQEAWINKRTKELSKTFSEGAETFARAEFRERYGRFFYE